MRRRKYQYIVSTCAFLTYFGCFIGECKEEVFQIDNEKGYSLRIVGDRKLTSVS